VFFDQNVERFKQVFGRAIVLRHYRFSGFLSERLLIQNFAMLTEMRAENPENGTYALSGGRAGRFTGMKRINF